jgi:hypothetical protein
MMKVVSLCRYKNRDTVEVLEALVAKARAGEITGIALCYRTSQGAEDALITGRYAASTDLAAAAALRMSMKLANARGEY